MGVRSRDGGLDHDLHKQIMVRRDKSGQARFGDYCTTVGWLVGTRADLSLHALASSDFVESRTNSVGSVDCLELQASSQSSQPNQLLL